jgi:hypothetical protein
VSRLSQFLKESTAFHLFLIALLSFLAYSNTLDVPFHFDDKPYIVENPMIKDFRYFIEPSQAGVFANLPIYKVFKERYIGHLSFALNYKLHGLDVSGYHTANIVIHIINGLLVYFMVLFTFRIPKLERSRLREGSKLVALFTALLFISHPVQTQAVTYIVQRFASMATMFYILSLMLYIKSRLSTSKVISSMLSSLRVHVLQRWP